jgi:hypothetical protein
MNIKTPIKFLGISSTSAVSFSALLLLSIFSSTISLLPIRSAFADSSSDGYNEGCYDADRDVKALNGHGYDESVHHGDTQFLCLILNFIYLTHIKYIYSHAIE